jgi:hypothetical protein
MLNVWTGRQTSGGVRSSQGFGPFEKMPNNLVFGIRMGDGAHVAKILKLHELNSRQRGR